MSTLRDAFTLTRTEARARLGWSDNELDHRTVTINRMLPAQIARLRRCDLVPAFRPRMTKALWQPHGGGQWVPLEVAAREWGMAEDEVKWCSVCVDGLLLRDVVKVCAAGLAPCWYRRHEADQAPARYLRPFRPTAKLFFQFERLKVANSCGIWPTDWQTTYRGYHALYSELDVARAYKPADAIATLQPATA